MSTRPAPVEIDFLGLEKDGAPAGPNSTGGILQDALFGLEYSQLLRTFLNSRRRAAAVDEARCKRLPPPVPVMRLPAASRCSVQGSPQGTAAAAPLTIFYNGTVAVFDLPRPKAEAIIRWAEMSNAGVLQRVERSATDALSGDGSQQQRPDLLLENLGGVFADIPLARKKSLQRFLEKRKESRLTAVLPCTGSNSSSSGGVGAGDFGEDEKGKSSSWKRQKLSSSI